MMELENLASVLARAGACRVKRDAPLGPLTTLGVGGEAAALATPSGPSELAELLRAAADVPLFLLGGGSNTVVADRGWRGLVVKLGEGFSLVEIDGTHLRCGAGAALSSALAAAERAGLSGLEELCGIPGTVGGAVVGNAGAWGRQIGELVVAVDAMTRDGESLRLAASELAFGYRKSALAGGGLAATSVELAMTQGDPERIRLRRAELLAERKRRQPWGVRTAGSFFRNPPGDAAGRLIDRAGCKGWREGGAAVSGVHADFIVNEGGASASDVLRLSARVREAVSGRFGILLEPEVVLVGAAWPWEGGGA